MTETLNDEVTTLDLSFGILCPQTNVGAPIVVVEDFGVIEVLIQMQKLVQLTQSNDCIAVGVVERVIKIDEKVGVLHARMTSVPYFI